MTNSFKVGDRVICTNNENNSLKIGDQFIVESIDLDLINLKGVYGGFYFWRFQLEPKALNFESLYAKLSDR